ncbi:hypothetical protein [Streptomyces sp. CB03238]|uniref:hypothetical protein n=1 Tax=Streptomyces sp. CB03238 TaxID=1907777 RepID=UPI000A10F72E|nr:hypothetical protein [Streptomyces sp. CB03238]ORT58677.1 hypothetical protein BKD26_15940 [Streptomyces sp. CB03238]
MAGESPDKSEQQKSPGETASNERDPRLAVLGDAGSPEGDAEVRVDQPTAVFRALPRDEADREGGDARDADREDADAKDGDARLRDAVAAWVTKADGPAAATATDDDEPGESAAPEAPAAGKADEPGAESVEPSSQAGPSAQAEESARTAETAATAAERGDSSGKADVPVKADVSPRASEPPAKADEPAREAAEVSAAAGVPVREAAEQPAKADEPARAGVAAEQPAKADEVSAKADVVSAAAGRPVREGDQPVREADDPVRKGDQPVRKADDPVRKGDQPVREADQVSADADEPSAATGDEAARKADEPSTEADEPARAGVADEPSAEADEPSAEAEASAEAAAASREDEQPPVDQPTAVFRAVQRKPVDQPTTALKAITPESPAERTSKFVPLRADDVRPAAKKPEPQAPAPAPAPTSSAPAKAGGPPASLTEAERTKQQPLPPRPPLDMLAELTNTPPPPETPVRTVVRRVKIWTPLVVLLAIVFAIVQFVRPLPAPTLAMTAKPSYTFEGGKPSLPWPNEGQGYMSATGLGTVDSFGEQKPVPIGSVAKAMTAYVILKEHPLKEGSKGEMIEIDALAETEGGYDAQNESTLNTVKAGDKISQYDALAAIMIPSANNIARLLARWDAGSEKAFVKKMNDTAKELGMKNTTYTDPSGLNHTTVSSAEDQVKLGEKLVEIPALLEITAKPWWTDPSGKKWRNYNDLVPYDGALGIKTGSTTKAGGNLLFAAHKKVGDTDQLIVGAVLAQYKTPILGSAIAASKEAMKATQALLESQTVVKKGDVVGHVDDGLGGRTPVVATKDVTVVGWSGLTVRLELGNGGRALPHSAPAGTQVGVLTVGEGASQVRVPVALKSAMAEPGLGDKLTRLG